jgi:hypothetical protein
MTESTSGFIGTAADVYLMGTFCAGVHGADLYLLYSSVGAPVHSFTADIRNRSNEGNADKDNKHFCCFRLRDL